MSIKPISPDEATKKISDNFPEFVIEAVNNCINKNYFGKNSFTIKQEVIVDEILNLAPPETTRRNVYDNHWLDFEEIYKEHGWSVKYDKPAYDENYDAFFEFKVKK